MSRERDVFANFERMRREMDELFGDAASHAGFAPRRAFSPRVDVWLAADPPRVVVAAELAGIDPSEVGLEVRGRQLLIVGERRPGGSERRRFQQLEIPHGRFRRVVNLGSEVVAEEASAVYEDGVLRIEVPIARRDLESHPIPIEPRRSVEGAG